MVLLSYRATLLPWCGLSPAELLFGRRVRTNVPQVKRNLIPNWPHVKDIKRLDSKHKATQKRNYDWRHKVKDLPTLPKRLPVWVDHQGSQVPGEIVQRANSPRSYIVETQSGGLRRNRRT